MKKIMSIAAVILTPYSATAQGFSSDGGPLGQLLVDILAFSNDYLIPFIVGIGFLFFVWGIFRYFIFGGANDESKAQGKSLLVYATIGFVAILIFWGVVNLLAESTGFAGQGLQNIPSITDGVPQPGGGGGGE